MPRYNIELHLEDQEQPSPLEAARDFTAWILKRSFCVRVIEHDTGTVHYIEVEGDQFTEDANSGDDEPDIDDEPPPDYGTHAGAVIREYDD